MRCYCGAAAADDVAVRGVAGGDAAFGCILIPSAVGGAVVNADIVGAVVTGGVAAGDAVMSAVDFGGGVVSGDTDDSIAVGGAASGRVVVGGNAAAVGGGAAVDSTVDSGVGVDGAGVGVPLRPYFFHVFVVQAGVHNLVSPWLQRRELGHRR